MRRKKAPLVSEFPALQKKGIGAGEYSSYEPLLNARSSTSIACRYRTSLSCTGRLHHFLSFGEWAFALMNDWEDTVVDLREQVPLNPQLTEEICSELQIRHPKVLQGDVVMSTDLLVYQGTAGRVPVCRAFQIKKSREEAQRPRTAEKIRVERAYWKRRNTPFAVVYSEDFNPILISNLRFFQPYRLHRRERTPELKEKVLETCREFFKDFEPETLLAEIFRIRQGSPLVKAFRLAVANKILSAPMEELRASEWRLFDLEVP